MATQKAIKENQDDRFKSQEYIDGINKAVNTCMEKWEKQYIDEKASKTSLDFKAILGASDDEYWWRLYINPKDWEDAIKAGDPRLLYDKDALEEDQPKGFRNGIKVGYEKYLVKGRLNNKIGPEGKGVLTMGEYESIFDNSKPEILKSKGGKTPPKLRGDKDDIDFGGPENLAKDLEKEILQLAKDVESTKNKKYTPVALVQRSEADTLSMYFPGERKITTRAKGELLKNAIQKVFEEFNTEIHAASAGKKCNQLRAIARVVRRLHIIHAFTNGCGRTNIFTLLPLLLLRYGFGLPLGGERGSELPKGAIHMLFNGGYTVEQIARFLYISQDFGLLNSGITGKLAKNSCLGPKDKPVKELVKPGKH